MHGRIWACFLLLLADCITPYVPPTTSAAPQLVVNGLITDRPGPHTVKISIASPASTNYFSFPPYGAHVFIQDNLGNEEELGEVMTGTFETSSTGIQGVVGRMYSVKVILSDGARYESTPELLKSAPSIDTVYTAYEDLPPGSDLTGQFVTYVETQDPDTPDNYYKWSWKHYTFRTHCVQVFNNGIPERFPCCERCWDIDQCESCIAILSDRFGNGKRINQFLLNIPYDSKDPYFLTVEQLSISKNAYNFWMSLSNQVNNVGGVFDPPPTTVRGNLFNVSNPKEQVLGYFGASGLSVFHIFVKRGNINKPPKDYFVPYTAGPTCYPCLETYFRTSKKPSGWID